MFLYFLHEKIKTSQWKVWGLAVMQMNSAGELDIDEELNEQMRAVLMQMKM